MLSAFWGMIDPSGYWDGPARRPRTHSGATPAWARPTPRQPSSHSPRDSTAARHGAEWERAIALAQESDADSRVARATFDLGYARANFAAGRAGDRDGPARGPAELERLCEPGGHAPKRREVRAARTAARRAMELDPESLYAAWAMLYALSGGDAIDEARRFAREARSRFGRHPWLMMGESVNLPADADRTEAVARYDELAARSRTDYVQPAVLSSAIAACAGRLGGVGGLAPTRPRHPRLPHARPHRAVRRPAPGPSAAGSPGGAPPHQLESARTSADPRPRLTCHNPDSPNNSTLRARHSSEQDRAPSLRLFRAPLRPAWEPHGQRAQHEMGQHLQGRGGPALGRAPLSCPSSPSWQVTANRRTAPAWPAWPPPR